MFDEPHFFCDNDEKQTRQSHVSIHVSCRFVHAITLYGPIDTLTTETPAIITKLYSDFVVEMSQPSSSPHDTVIERDQKRSIIKIDGVTKLVQKQFHVKFDYDVFE